MPKLANNDWSPDFINWVFLWWYNHNRPAASRMYMGLPRAQSEEYPAEFVKHKFAIPTVAMLKTWIDSDFIHRANRLDLEAKQALDNQLVSVKVDMLKRHAFVGEQMQNMAMEFLDAHKDDLGVNNAVKLLVEGLRIERESRGIPETLEKMSNMSDDKLMEEIKSLLANSPVSFLPPENMPVEEDIVEESNVIDAEDI